MRLVFEIEDNERIVAQRPAAQSWQVEGVRVPATANAWLFRNKPIGAFQRINEAERDGLAGLQKIEIYGLIDIELRASASNDGLGRHTGLSAGAPA